MELALTIAAAREVMVRANRALENSREINRTAGHVTARIRSHRYSAESAVGQSNSPSGDQEALRPNPSMTRTTAN